jgi:hypothetical protein
LRLATTGRYSGRDAKAASVNRRTVVAAFLLVSAFSVFGGTLGAQQTPSRADGSAPGTLTSIVAEVQSLFPKVSGSVLEVHSPAVTISIGRRDGLVPGVELSVVREGRELHHPKTGELLGKTEKEVGRVRVTEVQESYATATLTHGGGLAPGDVARVSAGKIRLTVVPFVTSVRDGVVEAALAEIVDGLNRTGRFQVGMSDQVGVWAAQRGMTPEDVLEGKGLAEAAKQFKIDHVLVLHFKTVQRKPYVEARAFSLPDVAPLVTSSAFVPPSVRATPGQRFSGGADRQPPQPKQRSLLARLLGGELEAGSYSTGDGSIPLKEIGRFAFPIIAMDVSVSTKDQIPRLVFTDGEKIWLYKIVERALEPEWTFTGGFSMSPGKIVSVQLADLDGDGVFEIVANRFHPDPAVLLTSFILRTRDGKAEVLVRNFDDILWAVDAAGDGIKKTLWGQRFNRETFFRKGDATRYALKGNGLVADGGVRVPATFRATGVTMSSIGGKGTRNLVFVDEYQRLRVSVESEETWRSSTPVGGGSHLKLELLQVGTTSRMTRSQFFNFEPVPLSVDLDGDGVDEVLIPQNQLEGHIAIVFRGPAGYRFQSVNSGFEGTITGLGAIPGETPPSLIATVVRFNNFLKSSGETQIIMTTGE